MKFECSSRCCILAQNEWRTKGFGKSNRNNVVKGKSNKSHIPTATHFKRWRWKGFWNVNITIIIIIVDVVVVDSGGGGDDGFVNGCWPNIGCAKECGKWKLAMAVEWRRNSNTWLECWTPFRYGHELDCIRCNRSFRLTIIIMSAIRYDRVYTLCEIVGDNKWCICTVDFVVLVVTKHDVYLCSLQIDSLCVCARVWVMGMRAKRQCMANRLHWPHESWQQRCGKTNRPLFTSFLPWQPLFYSMYSILNWP